jgi:hypothetical protein
MKTNTGPIFIGGLDRCGKTTLRAFLVSHSNISIPAVGSNMWTYFYGQFGDLSNAQNFERCLKAMLNYKHVRFLKPDADQIRREFWLGEPAYGRLFGIFLEQFSQREGKSRWGEQTGLIERYADIVFKAYPEGRMIHMLRDPRDRYAESLKMWPNGKGRAGGATARWLYTTGLAKRNLKKYPKQYKIVRFEDLVYKTESTLRDVCKFIGEEFNPEMLTMSGAPEHRAKLSREAENDALAPLLSQSHIGLYRANLPKSETAFMQSISKTSLHEFGYKAEPMYFSTREALLFTSWHWPSNFIRFVSWLGIEFFQQNYPETFGRNPAAHMVIKDVAAT